MLLLVVAQLLLIVVVGGQSWTSPCPKIFQYEPLKPNEPDRWYGKAFLTTDTDLIDGVWLNLIFDKPATQIGTRFGQKIYRLQPTEYMIQNLGFSLRVGDTVTVNFFVKFNTASEPPKLVGFRVNARQVCPKADMSTTTESDFITSDEYLFSPTENIFVNTTSSNKRPSNNKTTNYYPGDINLQTMNNIPIQHPILEIETEVPCGKVAEKPIGLIAFGENTTPGQWPWHVAIYNFIEGQMRYSCGGSLISKQHVLTAAHCVTQPRTTIPVALEILAVFLGKHSLKAFGPEVQEREVSKITVHPDFTSNVLFNDIAVLTLSTPVKYTDFVRKVCLWDDYIAQDIVHDRLGTVVGWGFDENRQVSNYLKQVEMPVVPTGNCILSNTEFFSKVVNSNNYCGGYRNGSSACNGDSGGGMVFPKTGTTGANTIWQIRGLVSIGVALQGQYICDNKQFIVFTDVAQYLRWIKNTIKEK